MLQAAHTYADRNTNEEGGGGYQAYNWDGVSWGVYVLLAQIDGPSSEYPQKVTPLMAPCPFQTAVMEESSSAPFPATFAQPFQSARSFTFCGHTIRQPFALSQAQLVACEERHDFSA